MFTGIIKKTSVIQKVGKKSGNIFLSIKIPAGWKVFLGQSLAINGVCSTVKKISRGYFEVEYMPETIKKTTASFLREGDLVNLERSLKLNDFVDGHLVQGHVDGIGKIAEIKKAGLSVLLKISVAKKLMRFIAPKGSVAIDGISLTVVDIGKNWLSVSLVRYNLENTNLGKIKKGDRVNIETDVLAKYLARLVR